METNVYELSFKRLKINDSGDIIPTPENNLYSVKAMIPEREIVSINSYNIDIEKEVLDRLINELKLSIICDKKIVK